MRRIGQLLVGGLMASSVLAADLPSGKFEGKGTWRGPEGSTGTYTVTTEIEGRTLTSHYVWSEPAQAGKNQAVTVTFGSEGRNATFAITDGAGKSVGEGFCFDGNCAYKTQSDSISIEETLRFVDGKLLKLGSKTGPGFRVVWTEELSAR